MTPRRILAATDGSPVAEHATGLAQLLAAAAGAECRVVGVETGVLPAGWRGKETVGRGTASSATTWRRGVPGVEIVRKAESWQADLVVLGRCPRTPEEPRPLGPTSEMVLRRHAGATLLAPPTVSALKRVLVALDGTPRGLGVLEGAAPFMRAWVAECHTLCVLPPELPEDASWSDPRRIRVGQALDAWKPMKESPARHFRHGSPVRLIRQMAHDLHTDVLVLGVRRGGPSGDMGSGHVGRDLLSIVPCAILCIPI